jgi:hypothetical protein
MKLLVQAVPMPTKVLRSNLARGEVYSIQLYVIKCVRSVVFYEYSGCFHQ